MPFRSTQFSRTGSFPCRATLAEVFPLLCPKREEDWIPGWECETLWSKSGFNEEGAVFRTLKPYGTELFWHTLRYDPKDRLVDFLITAPGLFLFRFKITVDEAAGGILTITFHQTFTSLSEGGDALMERYRNEDLPPRLKALGEFLEKYLRGS